MALRKKNNDERSDWSELRVSGDCTHIAWVSSAKNNRESFYIVSAKRVKKQKSEGKILD